MFWKGAIRHFYLFLIEISFFLMWLLKRLLSVLDLFRLVFGFELDCIKSLSIHTHDR
jgi:hypothetical protein